MVLFNRAKANMKLRINYYAKLNYDSILPNNNKEVLIISTSLLLLL